MAKLEDCGLHFCYKITTEDGDIIYIVAKSLNQATGKVQRVLIEDVKKVEYLGRAIKW